MSCSMKVNIGQPSNPTMLVFSGRANLIQTLADGGTEDGHATIRGKSGPQEDIAGMNKGLYLVGLSSHGKDV